MDVKFDYEQGVFEIDQMLSKMPKEIESQERPLLRKLGTIVKGKIKKYLHNSDIEARAKEIPPSNYDGSRPYEHVRDDVTADVRKDKNGMLYASIRGGKMTGYKWNKINDGHFARDGYTWVPGNQFMDKAMKDAQGEVEKAIDDMVKKVTE